MIIVMGGITGGIGSALHKILAGIFYGSETTMPIGRKDCDVESEESISKFFAAISGNFNTPLHIINATGVSISAMIHKSDIMDINRMLRVNVTANILLLKHARELYKQHGGTFTMLSSITASDGPAGTAVYAASKSALHGLNRVAAKEFARINARVNCIELGYMAAGMIDQISLNQLTQIVKTVPLQRLGKIEDIAEAVRFLIQCEYATGSILKLNGGLS